MKEHLQSILKRHHINVTRARLAILEIFLQSKEGLSHQYFLKESGRKLDRVTVFRTLKLFTDKQLIYLVPAPDRVNRYVFEPKKPVIRVNFICTKCNRIYPLETGTRPNIILPEGFQKKNAEIKIYGICRSCKS